MKNRTKKERNAAKALARSKRNNPPKQFNNQQRRKARRRALRQFEQETGVYLPVSSSCTVQQLRDACATRGIKTTTKMRKAELLTLLGVES